MKTSMIGMSLFALSLVACGGDGGDGDDTVIFASGNWRGTAQVSSNPCALAVSTAAFSFTHSVNQLGGSVTVNDELGQNFTGSTNGDDGFSASAPLPVAEFPNGVTCNFTRTITYSGLSGNSGDSNANTADAVSFTDSGTCSGGGLSQCSVVTTGSGARS